MMFLNKYFKSHRRRRRAGKRARLHGPLNIRDLLPGQPARVIGFSPRLSPEQRALLQAYGLVPGYSIRVIQQSPVSVIRVEHAEIALEQDLAQAIFVIDE